MNENSLESFIQYCDKMQIAEEGLKDKDYNDEFVEMMKENKIAPGNKTYHHVKSKDENYISYVIYDENYSGTNGDYDNGLIKEDISDNKKMISVMKKMTSKLLKKYPGLKVSSDNYRGHGTIGFYMPKDNPYLSKVCDYIVKEMKNLLKSKEYITKYGKDVCDIAMSGINIVINGNLGTIYPPEHEVYKKINDYSKFMTFYKGINSKIKSFIKENYKDISMSYDMAGLCEWMVYY